MDGEIRRRKTSKTTERKAKRKRKKRERRRRGKQRRFPTVTDATVPCTRETPRPNALEGPRPLLTARSPATDTTAGHLFPHPGEKILSIFFYVRVTAELIPVNADVTKLFPNANARSLDKLGLT